MPRSLKVYIAGVVDPERNCARSQRLSCFPRSEFPAIAIRSRAGLPVRRLDNSNILAGIAFWTAAHACRFRSARCDCRAGPNRRVAMAPVLAAITLGGPAVGGWVAALGTTEMREIRGRIPWYGTLANHAGIALPAVIAGVVQVWVLKLGERPRAVT